MDCILLRTFSLLIDIMDERRSVCLANKIHRWAKNVHFNAMIFIVMGKMFHFGILMHHYAYCKDTWNIYRSSFNWSNNSTFQHAIHVDEKSVLNNQWNTKRQPTQGQIFYLCYLTNGFKVKKYSSYHAKSCFHSLLLFFCGEIFCSIFQYSCSKITIYVNRIQRQSCESFSNSFVIQYKETVWISLFENNDCSCVTFKCRPLWKYRIYRVHSYALYHILYITFWRIGPSAREFWRHDRQKT